MTILSRFIMCDQVYSSGEFESLSDICEIIPMILDEETNLFHLPPGVNFQHVIITKGINVEIGILVQVENGNLPEPLKQKLEQFGINNAEELPQETLNILLAEDALFSGKRLKRLEFVGSEILS